MRLMFGDDVIRELGDQLITIGRSPDNAWHFPSRLISRNHALIQRSGGGWLLVDLGSTGGTYANAQRIERHRLRPGDEVRFGIGGGPELTAIAEESPGDPTTDETQNDQTHGGEYARIEARLDEVTAENARYHRLLEQRIDKIEGHMSLIEKRQIEGENKISETLRQFGQDVLALRMFDKQQSREFRQAFSVLFWVLCVTLSIQLSISIGMSVRRNAGISAAVVEELGGENAVGRLIGLGLAGGIAYITGKGQGQKHGLDRAAQLDLHQATAGADRGYSGELDRIPGGGLGPTPPGGAGASRTPGSD